ncbi:MAG: ABC transporter permease [Chloroflexales bacterium]|nr:ABC transporter permease [Chloroflexales bacterium]
MLERIGIVLRKELGDAFRDRRTIANTLLSALLGPLMLFVLLAVIGQTAGEQAERPLDLPVAGAESAPGLMAFLTQRNAIIRPAPPHPEAAVRAGDADVILVIDTSYAERLDAGMPAPVQLVVDTSRQSAAPKIERVRALLEAYGGQLGALRLQARGVSPSLVMPLAVEEVDIATPESRAAQLLNVLPYFLVFSVFVGSMSLIIDMTAGERERGSLEPLLINPLSRGELVLAKLLAGLVPTVLSVIIALAGFAAVANLNPIGEQIGVRLSLGLPALAGIFLITLPMMLLAGALQMIIATMSRTVKEAQSYLAFLPLIPALPGLLLAFIPYKPALWMMLVPTFGQQILINQLMRGEAIAPLFATVASAVTLAVGAALTMMAVRLFGREGVLFGKGA